VKLVSTFIVKSAFACTERASSGGAPYERERRKKREGRGNEEIRKDNGLTDRQQSGTACFRKETGEILAGRNSR
jgi:hypothetical protein